MAQDHTDATTRDAVGTVDDPHELARPLRPQGFGRKRPRQIDNAIVEPAWQGVRVIAAVSGDKSSLWEDGEELQLVGRPAGLLEDVLAELRTATIATLDSAIFDGYLTKPLATEGIGLPTFTDEFPTMSGQITRMFVGGRGSRRDVRTTPLEEDLVDRDFGEDDGVSLVLTDLLWLDGDWLLDVPLLERRRVLESIVQPGELVRSGPFVRPPIDSWISSWRAQGFRGMTFKASNSRYRPGEASDEWTLSDLPLR